MLEKLKENAGKAQRKNAGKQEDDSLKNTETLRENTSKRDLKFGLDRLLIQLSLLWKHSKIKRKGEGILESEFLMAN